MLRQTETKLYKKEFATISKKNGPSTPFMVRSVLNLFETNQLGIFACATPRVIQQNSLIADFSLENNKALNPQVAFVHFKNSNVIQRILAQDGMNIHFALNDIIEIWMIDEDGNLLTSNPVSPTLKTKSHTFSMKQKGKVSNRQEVQRYLKAL